jgi:hypothetical protein
LAYWREMALYFTNATATNVRDLPSRREFPRISLLGTWVNKEIKRRTGASIRTPALVSLRSLLYCGFSFSHLLK